jgi:murein L,D-transpeptidase YafK
VRGGLGVLGTLLALALIASAHPAAAEELRIVVWKKRHELWVVRGDEIARRYPVSLGVDPEGQKQFRGDGRTPVGSYFVYEKRPSERFRRFLAISYPSIDDAERAFAAGQIDADTWADIWIAAKRHEKPPWDTPLGGFLGIHGTGGEGIRQARMRQVTDWTDGCIALSDSDIDDLFRLVPVGTGVEIRD